MKSYITSFIVRSYTRLFGKPKFQRFNNFILNLALNARGYNNFTSTRISGEDEFVKYVLGNAGPRVCLDVGANVGSYTRSLLKNTECAHVFAFEPLPAAFAVLSGMAGEFPGRLTCVNKGVSAACGKLDIHFEESASSHASFSEDVKKIPYVRNASSLEVDVTTLDAFFADHPFASEIDFMKIDTEGFESEVLAGAAVLLDRFKPKFIQIEFNWHQLFRKCSIFGFSEILADYVPYQLLPNGMVERDPKDPLANVYCFSNFVFVRRDVRIDSDRLGRR